MLNTHSQHPIRYCSWPLTYVPVPFCRAKQHQQELEDVALDLRAELDEARGKQEAAEQAAAASAQRAVAAEAKLEAAGLGAMPKMGPTAEQLVINSTQRIR